MQALMTIKNFLHTIFAAIVMLLLTAIGSVIVGALMYISIIIELYEEFTLNQRKKVDNE